MSTIISKLEQSVNNLTCPDCNENPIVHFREAADGLLFHKIEHCCCEAHKERLLAFALREYENLRFRAADPFGWARD